jgi:hypothetical protein
VIARGALIPFVLAGLALTTLSCQRQTREEMRRERLDTFRAVLPPEILASFDSIESEEDCAAIGEALSQARQENPSLDAAMDSLMHAELIDTFTDAEVVHFFWLYFDYALETGTVRGP